MDNINIDALDPAQDALNKMYRASQRGTGCRLTAEEIQSLALTSIGEMFSQDDPRKPTKVAKSSAAKARRPSKA